MEIVYRVEGLLEASSCITQTSTMDISKNHGESELGTGKNNFRNLYNGSPHLDDGFLMSKKNETP